MSRIILGALLVAGCAVVPPDGPFPDSGRVCDASVVQNLIGETASADLGQQAMLRSGSGGLRWIRPGDMVTMDFREDRLNIDLDGRNRVTGLRCG